ncbi:MAG TPA: hypothetical protein VKF39_01750 [Nitrososphaerales archaeon]|nr:hypothetical protein [Nitrososphaerales archaeon]
MQAKKVVATSTESASRLVKDRAEVAGNIDAGKVTRQIETVTNPKTPRSAMRKAGIALIVAPDPVTTVAGAGLLASSYAFRKDPADLQSLALETRKVLRDLRSLSV